MLADWCPLMKNAGSRRIDLEARYRKKNMKPKQTQGLPITLQDPYATRSSGFVSAPGPSKGKTTRKGVVCSLPLEKWSIGVDIPPHEATPDPQANLIWDRDGLLQVQHADSSTIFELRLNKKSLGNFQYTDLKVGNFPSGGICLLKSRSFHHLRRPSSRFVHWRRPLYKVRRPNRFKLGSHDANGLLTFKFDPVASDWDMKLYQELVRFLQGALVSKDGKSALDRPGARAVWEAAMRAHEDQPTRGRIESSPPDSHPKKVPDTVAKPRARPKPRTEVAPLFEIVRRSARLSGAEQQRFSPKPDPDEVILAYRSGAGSLNITNGDVSRLKPGEFLNDTLIEFGLKLWLADLHEKQPRAGGASPLFSAHSSTRNCPRNPEEGYNSVRKWTSKFDLFQKKYVIVPINENMHWYLAIIYLPGYTLLPRPRSSDELLEPIPHPFRDQLPQFRQEQTIREKRLTLSEWWNLGVPLPDLLVKQDDGQCAEAVDKDAPVDDAAGLEGFTDAFRTELPSLDQQVDVIEQEEHPVSISVSEGGSVRDSGIPPTTFYGQSNHMRRNVTSPEIILDDKGAPVDIVVEEDVIMANPDSEHEEPAVHPQTYIFTFDSLSSKHPQAVKRLSKYLLMEAHDKKQLEEDTLTEPKGMQAHVPHQPNHCDCGVYLLHFAKTFMKDPKLSSEIIQNRSSPQKGRRVHEHWDDTLVVYYRDELAARIHSMSDEWKRQRSEQDAAATKNQTEAAAAPQEQQQSSTDPTPAASSKADNDSDSEIEVLVSPKKATTSKAASRRYSGLADYSKRGAATRIRGG
ncbi:hypothetical protein H4582DRAFT_2072322 [Lactarius indigo]|nr:hypothetical protein H4582DRAFT_2072322 [Lactarius indigo]